MNQKISKLADKQLKNTEKTPSLLPNLALAAAILLGFFWFQNNDEANNQNDTDSNAIIELHNAIAYKFNKNGNLNFTLYADNIRHYNEEKTTEFDKPELVYITKDADNFLSSNSAVEKNNEIISMNGDVNGLSKPKKGRETKIFTQSADYLINQKQIQVNESIKIETDNLSSTADQATWNLDNNSFNFKGIRGTYAK